MTIHLINMLQEKNKVNKTISYGLSLPGELRDASDVINPTIMIKESVDVVCGYNYAYIPEFKRYYFINNVQSYRSNLSVLSMTVDVLTTYKESIMNSPVIITRSSAYGDADHSLPDDRLPVKQSETTHTITFDSLYSNSADPYKGQTMVLVLTGIDHPTD